VYATHLISKLGPLLYPKLEWRIPTKEKTVYLTFDDGPNPDITPWVLDVLDEYQMKATFFCIGQNVKKYPDTQAEVLKRGHTIGNHTFSHINGFQATLLEYIQDTEAAAHHIDSLLFRPPFGRIKWSQARVLQEKYRVIMWTGISGDYLQNFNLTRSLKTLKWSTKSGALLVFHDSYKAAPNLKRVLPEYCAFLKENGFTSKSL
jgi:peptidoglycan/xylan/chitin deacetylase (PgdA/CDA1 family)